MGLLCFIYLIGSLRTNICFFGIFLTLVLSFSCLSAAYWFLAEDFVGNAEVAGNFIKVSTIMMTAAHEGFPITDRVPVY